MERSAVEEADKLISVSRSLAEDIEDEFDRKSRVIYNGFSTPSSSGIDVKDRHGINRKMIFYVGRHAEQKGIEHLIYAFEKLVEEGEEATLVIGGEGHTTDSLKEFVEILDLEDQVIFTGFIPSRELGDYYRDAEVFVSPSINEPFGLTITEALESNTPVVATGSGAEEIAGDSIISVEGYSDSLKECIEDALEREEELDFENRSWDDMTGETVEVYKSLA